MRTKKRFLSLLLCGAMLFSLCTPSVYAEAQTTQDSGQITVNAGGLCEHHTEHNEDCGYTEGEPGTLCNHEHNEDCYTEITECIHKHSEGCYPEEAESSVSGNTATPSNAEEREPESCDHICDEESGCITKELDCNHEHKEDCGYSPAAEGTSCDFVCKTCNPQDDGEIKPPALSNGEETVTVEGVQAKIDALPAAIVFDGLSIGGQEVNGDNTDVLGDGSVSYTENAYNEATITLNNCKLPNGQITYSGNPGGRILNINLIGDNSLQMIDVTIADLNIKGSGSLTIQNDNLSCINNSGNVVISDSATVTLTCNSTTEWNEYGIYTNSNLIISSNSTVNVTTIGVGLQGGTGISITDGSNVTVASGDGVGIWSTGGSIQIDNSKVNAEGWLPGLNGAQGVSIQNRSEVTATSNSDCGIYSPVEIEINDSKVNAEGWYPGLNGAQGVSIQNGSDVTATANGDCGIYSPVEIEIKSSKVTAQGAGPGLQGDQGVTITDCTGDYEVKATSDSAAGIFIRYDDASITVSNSKVTATGYYAGLQTGNETTGYISITNGSKITAIATDGGGDGSGIYASNGFNIENSEVYAEGTSWGLYSENDGTVSGSWIRAEIGMGEGDYKPANSVTIQSGKWWVAGDAKIPEGVLGEVGDAIRIPENATLSIGETGKKIKGEVNGIAVDRDGALLLPPGTVIENKDGTQQTIGTGGGKITLAGEVADATVYTVTVNTEGLGSASASLTSATAGTKITLTATPDTGYHFKEWQVIPGGVTISGNIFTMPAENVIVKAIFEEDTYTVTLISNGGTINSGNVTEYTYGVGATLPTDVSKEGCVFAGWYQKNDCSGSPVTEISKTDTGDKMFYAKWVSTDAGVTEVSVDKTAGTISGSTITVVLPYGTAHLPMETDKVFITPADGATVSNLQLAESDGSEWTFTVTAEDKTTTKDYIIRVSIAPDPAAENKAAIAAAKSTIEARNWTVEQTTANTNEEVKAWIENQLKGMNLNNVGCTVSITGYIAATAGSSTDADGTDGSFTFTVSLSKGENSTLAQGITEEITGKVTATAYQAKNYTVTVSASPTAGGTVSGSGTFEENASVKVSAVAKDGYHFVKWTEDNSDVSTNADYTFTVTGDRTLVAIFEKDSDPAQPQQYTVTVQTNSNGTASASLTSATAGTKITLTATPNTGYHFKEWQVISGDMIISNNSFIMPAANVTVKAVFEKDSTPTKPTEYTVTVQADGSGTASASPTSAAQGEKITLTATPDSGWHFKEWQVVSGSVTISGNSFTMPAENVTVKAIFEKKRGRFVHPGLWQQYPFRQWYYPVRQPHSRRRPPDGYARQAA